MANGIKLRRGLKTALAGTIADGEFVFCTDSGELGFKKGTVEKYVDLEKLSTDIDGLQTEVDELQASIPSLLPGQFKVSVNKFYDFDLNPNTKPTNNGYFRIPIAKFNPLYTGGFDFQQVFSFSNVNIRKYDFDGYGVFNLTNLGLDCGVIDIQGRGGRGGVATLYYADSVSSTDLGLEILNDGSGNVNIWLKIDIDGPEYTTHKIIIAFDMYCTSGVGKDINEQPYNVCLPPLGLEITPYDGAR